MRKYKENDEIVNIMSSGSDFHDKVKQKLGYTQLGKIEDEYCLKIIKLCI